MAIVIRDSAEGSRLEILGDAPPINGRKALLCRCACGAERVFSAHKVITGHTKSCGCAKVERISRLKLKHGLSKKHPLWGVWLGMRRRCQDQNNQDWLQYGGRGIKVCERWTAFDLFVADMGDRPDGHTLDRIDVNGDYCPENCRWASWTTQERNRTNNHMLTLRGATKCIAEWAEELEMPYATLYMRVRRGWGADRILAGTM